MLKPFIALLLFMWVVVPASAAQPDLKGDFVQGGLVQGHTVPGTKISLNGRLVTVTPDGRMEIIMGKEI